MEVGGIVVGLETLAAAVSLLLLLFLFLLLPMLSLEVELVVFLGIDAGGDSSGRFSGCDVGVRCC